MVTKESIGVSVLLLFLTACASTNAPSTTSNKESTDYTSAFPTQDISQKLKKIQDSVVRISSTAIYTTYFFEDEPVNKTAINSLDINERATRKISENKSSAGTALAISANKNWGLLITNHHISSYPDTIFSYTEEPDGSAGDEIEAIAIKKNQNNVIYDAPDIGFFDVVGVNPKDDLALLEINLNESKNISITPLNAKVGDSKNLKLASVLYILGYPKGFPMVTRAIVSDPNRNEKGNFLTDALFNEGISGGIILASNNGYKTFEWVGMANTSYANAKYILVPDPLISKNFDPLEIYEGEVFVTKKTDINYGITEAIPMQTIIDFLLENKAQFYRRQMRLNKYQ